MESRERRNRVPAIFVTILALFVSLSITPIIAAIPTTDLIKIIDPTGNSKIEPFGVVGSKSFFIASEPNAKDGGIWIDYKLWVSDGTLAGTKMLQSFTLPVWSYGFDGVTAVGSKLFFFATDPTEDQGGTTHGTQLWSSDGTITGTRFIKNINPTNDYCCPDGASGNDFYIALGSRYLFTATDGTHGNELWSSDGTAAGTQVIKVINRYVNRFTTLGAEIVGSKIYFDVFDGTYANQLWISNGTAAGTKMVKKINPKGHAYFGNFNALGSKMFFNATDGIHGNELWTSNGTATGTKMVKDINPKGNSNIANSLTWKSRLYFTANDGSHGNELWSSDGTSTGTRMIKDINPKGNSDIDISGIRGSRLYFTATDGSHGIKLWSSDGTAAGTRMEKT